MRSVSRQPPLLQQAPGTYLLCARADRARNIRIGARGIKSFKTGYYLYVGSAFGPGGINARVGRHCRRRKPKRWHIDYLTEHFPVISALISYDKTRWEHRWAGSLSNESGIEVISGFGNSDCNCSSHLFFCGSKPNQAALMDSLAGVIDEVILKEQSD